MTDTTDSLPSGRFVLRIEPGLHAALRDAAAELGISLNEYCARKLATPGAAISTSLPQIVTRATALLGDAVLGIVAFGSWARGELAEGSDVDVLVVLESDVPITRALYTDWDERPIEWESRPVEPLFVHLAAKDARISGTWAEIATDGVILWERGFVVSRRLGALRRRIAAGELVRRLVHGQGYWVEAA